MAELKEGIAIIGMACRFPGAPTINAFWDLLMSGQSPLQEIPNNRWDVDQYYDADEKSVGKMYVRHGYFLENIDQFDPQFFRISPKEAVTLDPQHRLLLEVSWEALANAGIAHSSLLNSNTGVFIGLMNHDYGHLLKRYSQPSEMNFFAGLGNSSHCAAGRIAYTFGLQGPCFTLDTACSSSLVSLHLATQALRQRECHLAVVGAANLILDPHLMISMCDGKVLARDGRCKTFDMAADGYGRGEGSGVLVLKRLSDAKRDHDRILAVIRGTGINQDGPSNGLTVPNGEAQRALLRTVMMEARLAPADMSYLEAHGSATPLGDLIEINSVAAVFSHGRVEQHPLIISSVKPYIGHLEAASGMAGLIKVILSLQNECIPKHLHLTQHNPHFNLPLIPAIIPEKVMPWKRGGKKRIAGVSSFGISGTNAHVILEESDEISQPTVATPNPFQRKRYWSNILDNASKKTHPLVNLATPQIKEISYQQTLRLTDHPYLYDHRVAHEFIFPAACFIEMALAVSDATLKFSVQHQSVVIKDFAIEKPLALQEHRDYPLQITIKTVDKNTYHIDMSNEDKEHHAKGFLSLINERNDTERMALSDIKQRCFAIPHITELYAEIEKLGLKYGRNMRPIEQLWIGENEALAKLSLSSLLTQHPFLCHPVLLDGAFQVLALSILHEQLKSGTPDFYLPIGIKELLWHYPLRDTLYVHVSFPNFTTSAEIFEAEIKLYDEAGKCLAEVRDLCLRRTHSSVLEKRLLKNKEANPFLYQEQWQNISANPLNPSTVTKWIIFGTANPLATDIQKSLQAKGKQVHIAENINQVVQMLASPEKTGVIYLRALETSLHELSIESFDVYLQEICNELLVLFNKQYTTLCLITQNARKVSASDHINLHQAAIWGMVQCARHELQDRQLRCVDIDADSTQDFDTLLDDTEQQTAYRKNQRYALRILPSKTDDNEKTPTLNGTYLITGGLGGLGLSIANWLVQNGVRHLALVSRHASRANTQQQIEKLRMQGAHILTFQADVSDANQIHHVLQTLRHPDTKLPPLKGIIHSAGVLADGFITNQDWNKYQTVLRPKMHGAWHLHCLTQEDDLDHFILFSSIASVVGSPGQSNYGAANAFLDALSQFRKQKNLPALSINWGPWSEVGMASAWENLHKSRGVTPFTPEKGAALFGSALCFQTESQIMIADIHWEKFLNKTLISNKKVHSLKDSVIQELKNVLGFSAEEKLSDDENFFSLGMDSLLALQFNDALQKLLHDKFVIPQVAIFQYPTINSLVKHIESHAGSLQ